jgi:hypothetical protein
MRWVSAVAAAPRDASNMKLLEVHYRPAAAAAATQRWQFVVIVECAAWAIRIRP